MSLVLAGLVGAALFNWREEIAQTGLDPKVPFQTYVPPPAPDYAAPAAWAVLPAHPAAPGPDEPPADVFFVHPTTFDGGRGWLAPADGRGAPAAMLARVMLPNYAAPFARAGRVFAPRYRQASLYATQLTLRDDAREAQAFAFRDVEAAFRLYLRRWGGERPFLLVGVEQGGVLVDRLSREVLASPALRGRLVAAYVLEATTRADRAPPLCRSRAETGCRVAYASAWLNDFTAQTRLIDRALVWDDADAALETLGRRPSACVDPVTGTAGGASAAKANLGAANATGLEWGARPALLAHRSAARCAGGVLRLAGPSSPDFRRTGSWTDRLKVRPTNLFWADLEADAVARRDAWLAARR